MIDIEKLNFKAGLEIHQQLDTNKLFCKCPSILRNDEPSFVIKRRLHAAVGETGEFDEAVLHEAAKDRQFIYQGYDSICLVELDESPPYEINEEALKIAIQISLLLHCRIVPVTQIMRKIVIDGSNTSGFQRTVLIAMDGYVETSFGKVGISSVALEEDAARIIESNDKECVYRLDRLGIPLVEISTYPDMKNPMQVKEVALHIGEVLRSCKVKRGIGTIRQDVNLSIAGHERVEIKGFQEPKMFIKTIEIEINRQIENIKKNKTCGEVRRAKDDGTTEFMRPMPGAARMYPETDLPLLFIPKSLIDEAKNTLPRLKKEIRNDLKDRGLDLELVNLVLSEDRFEEVKDIAQNYRDINLIAKMLVLWPKEFSKKEGVALSEVYKRMSVDAAESIIDAINSGRISKEDVQDIIFRFLNGENLLNLLNEERVSEKEVEKEVVRLLNEKPGLSINAYMGLVMNKFKGRISGKIVMEIIKKYIA